MPETKNRKFKILGAGWLGLGGLAFAVVFLALAQIAQAIIDPSAAEVEGGFWHGLIFVLVFLVVGAICLVNGLALLRRNSKARALLAISSLVLLIPSAMGLVGLAGGTGVAGGSGALPLLVVAPSLWFTLSRGGKEAFESYTARENG